MNLKTPCGWAWGLGLAYFLVLIVFRVEGNDPIWLLLGALVSLVLLVKTITFFIKGVRNWKESKMWIVPSILCLAFLFSRPVAFSIGNFINDRQFKSDLSQYDKIVNAIQRGDVGTELPIGFIHPDQMPLPTGVRQVMVEHGKDKEQIILFLRGGSALGGHAGYLFQGYGQTSDDTPEPWPLARYDLRTLGGGWYHFEE